MHRRAGWRRGAPEADVVVLDANLRTSLVCIRSLGRAGCRVAVVCCASRAPAPAFSSRYATSVHVVPDVDRDEAAYVDALLELSQATGARVLIATGDASVSALRAHRDDIEACVRLALPAEATMAVFVDKTRTLELARHLGVRTPRGILVTDAATAEQALREIGVPAIVKPIESYVHDKRGAAARLQCSDAADAGELRALVRSVVEQGGTPLVQEWVPGAREAVHVFAVDGEVTTLAAQVNERTHPPLGGDTVLRRTVQPPADVVAAARALARATGLTGYAEVEFRRDAEGRPVLMEVNPRLSASVEVAVRAGADFPLLIWQAAAGLPLQAAVEARPGVRMRWLGGDLRWLASNLVERGRPHRTSPGRSIARFASEFTRGDGYDYLGWSDPRPAAAALVGVMRRARHAATTRSTAHPALGMPTLSGEG